MINIINVILAMIFSVYSEVCCVLYNNQLIILMSQIQKKPNTQPRKLFKYHLEKNIAEDAQESTYLYRLNRFRFNSYNQDRFFKWAKLRNPLLFGGAMAIVWSYMFKFYEPAHQGH